MNIPTRFAILLILTAVSSLGGHVAFASDNTENFSDEHGRPTSYLPSRLRTDPARGFQLTKYSLAQSRDSSMAGLLNGKLRQGGLLRFRVQAVDLPDEVIKPMPLIWKAVEWQGGAKFSARGYRVFPKPHGIESFVDVALTRQQLDLLWQPEANQPVEELERAHEQEAMANRGAVPRIACHVIFSQQVNLAAELQVSLHAERDLVREQYDQWLQSSEQTNTQTPGPVVLSALSANDGGQFIRTCVQHKAIRLSPQPEEVTDDLARAILAQLRTAWLDYDLIIPSDSEHHSIIALRWRDDEPLTDAIDMRFASRAQVESYRPIEVDTERTLWSLSVVKIDGLMRETNQRIHFQPVGPWHKMNVIEVGIEVVYEDTADDGDYQKKAILLVPIGDAETTWSIKGRYSNKLQLSWRPCLVRLVDPESGKKHVKMLDEQPWNIGPAIVFDDFRYLFPSSIAALNSELEAPQ